MKIPPINNVIIPVLLCVCRHIHQRLRLYLTWHEAVPRASLTLNSVLGEDVELLMTSCKDLKPK